MSDFTARIADLLEAIGLTREDAERLAREAARAQATAAPGTGYGNLTPQQIQDIWKRAARAGARKITLEITAEGHDQDDAAERGRVSVLVVDVQMWEGWTPEQAAQQAATDALLNDLADVSYVQDDPRAGWSEIDYMANGEDCPDVFSVPDSWTATVQEMAQEGPQTFEQWQEAQARARAERMN